MNILIPDRWLRNYLKTKATPEQIKEYVSLCGPSVERIYGEGDDTVYDMEITGNRPDAMSVMGVAREAATILPRFGIAAELTGDPYGAPVSFPKGKRSLTLHVKTDPSLNPRWTSVVIDNVTVAASPTWLTKFLELSGIRSLNNVVDITNFLMRAYGQPAHVFDYDEITGHTMHLRESKKGETLTTLDGKTHSLPGRDIVIEDGSGDLIDLCGIMGGKGSSVSERTHRVILFLQTYDATHIRKTSMGLAHRTEAAALFEKGLDTELVKPVFCIGLSMMTDLTGGTIASDVTDLYPSPYKPPTVSVTREKIRSYIGDMDAKEITHILTSLGCRVSVTPKSVSVKVPSFRRDIAIDVDVIEELARVHGYHAIPSKLPESAPPLTMPDPQLAWEENIKIRLRDWGYTELLTYSMISEEQMDLFGFAKDQAYTIQNPLSRDWVYMRPHAIASALPAFVQNLNLARDLRAFELSMSYIYRVADLPQETSVLNVLWSGDRFFEAKGLAETLFAMFGVEFIPDTSHTSDRYTEKSIKVGEYASLGVLKPEFTRKLGTDMTVTRLYMNIDRMVRDAKPAKRYVPIPKHPPIVEDLSFAVPDRFAVGPLITTLKSAHPLVANVELLDVHENSRTLHITYQDPTRTLTGDDVAPARKTLLSVADKTFGIRLKTA